MWLIEMNQNSAIKLDNPRLTISVLWISHFLLWTFGDMLALLQGTVEPIMETAIMVVAPSLAIIQTLMIVYSLKAGIKYVRTANIVITIVFLLFNIQYVFEHSEIWAHILGVAYILCNLQVIWTAWKMPKE